MIKQINDIIHMGTNAYTMGLKPDSHMENSLTIQNVSTLSEYIALQS